MGNANSVLTESEARHLMRRAGFGATAKELAKLVKKGLTRGQLVDNMLKYKTKPLKASDSMDEVYDRWLELMLKTKTPLLEKLTLFWHDHFSTANDSVGNAEWMTRQNGLLRQMGKGNFRVFLKAINKDPAMMDFLDTLRNRKKTPNENYPRELLELFSLGTEDETGAPNYAQEDIVQIARAFTGWRLDDDDNAEFREGSHDFNADYPERGPKVIFATHGNFGPAGFDIAAFGEGAIEIDVVVDVILGHRDTQGQSTVGRRIARRMFEYFASDAPTTALVDEILAMSGFAVTWDIAALVKTILTHDAFYVSALPPPFDAGTKKSVKWPIDYVVTTLRLLRVRPKGGNSVIPGGDFQRLFDHLSNMGQVLLDPPSVFGWDWEGGWLSSATLLARYSFASDLTAGSGRSIRLDKLLDLSNANAVADDVVAAVTDLLGVSDDLTAPERAILVDYLTDGSPAAPVDLTDFTTRDKKLTGLVGLVLQSPAYQVH